MGGDPAAFVEDLDRAGGDADIDGLAQQAVGHGVETGVDLDVVVETDPGAAPFGVFVRRLWQGPQRRPIEPFEELAAGSAEMAHDAGIQIGGQPAELLVELVEGEEGAVAKPRQNPTLDDLDADFDLGLVARLSRPGTPDALPLMLPAFIGRVLDVIAWSEGRTRGAELDRLQAWGEQGKPHRSTCS